MMKPLGLLIAISVLCLTDTVSACTIFRVTRGATTLVGNNEDDNTTATRIWFLAPEKGKYGRVFFGFTGGPPQGGMNDQGLFFDWVADNPSDDWKRDPTKLNYAGSVSEKILEETATVEEALEVYEKWNETAFLKSRTMLVDKTGASAIVGWKDGKVTVVRSHERFQAMGFGYGTASERLAKIGDVSFDSVRSILKSCVQSGQYPTQYSNIYDLRHGEVWVYFYHREKPPVRLNLQAELVKGHHYYDLPLLAEQMKQSLMTDFKTQKEVEVDPAVYTSYVGQYRIEPDYLFTITVEEGKLYFEAHDAYHTRLFAASNTQFFIRSLDSCLLFKLNQNGRVDEASLHVRGKDVPARRVK
ncbi:MAG: DUF3471 domain-containing protein [Acidobacteria bacterium]|nr:MAG: DUF3471 domain-containing protein [Acidobacteriota bacterium]